MLSQTTSIFVADAPRYALPNSRLHLGHRSKPSSTKAVRGVLIFFLALLKIHAPLFFRYPPSCGSRLKRLEIVIIYIFRCASLFPLPPLGEVNPGSATQGAAPRPPAPGIIAPRRGQRRLIDYDMQSLGQMSSRNITLSPLCITIWFA